MKSTVEQIILSIKSLPEPEKKIFFSSFAHDEYLVEQVLSLIENESDEVDVTEALKEYSKTKKTISWDEVKKNNNLL